MDRAYAAATTAFSDGPWPDLPARTRAQILNRIADGIEARAPRIAELETFDTGLPITQARGQAPRAAENFRFFADMAVTRHEDAFNSRDQFGYVIRRPPGWPLITPWNTPFMLATWKLAPALASGSTVVLKPAEAGRRFRPACCRRSWPRPACPTGCSTWCTASARWQARRSWRTRACPASRSPVRPAPGARSWRRPRRTWPGLSMELGGKSPCVVFADADLDQAIDSALFGVFSLNGERCTAGSWILAERAIYDALVTRLASRAGRIRVGDPADPRTEIGALVHPEHYARVLGYVQAGRDEGARLVAVVPGQPHLPAGNYLAATVFADVEPSMRIFREEIFGPVVCVTPFGDEAEAVALANATDYGLAAYIWTSDLARAHRVAHAVEAGMTWINSHNVRDLRTPFGGVKASGLGREGGPHSLDFYTESRIVHIPLGDTHVPRFGA